MIYFEIGNGFIGDFIIFKVVCLQIAACAAMLFFQRAMLKLMQGEARVPTSQSLHDHKYQGNFWCPAC